MTTASDSEYHPTLSAEDIESFIADHFPAARDFGAAIESIEPGAVRVRLPHRPSHLRPGGTVSGPALMTLADTAMYFLVLAHLGRVGLAVTTHLSIDFLRKPTPGDILADATLLKLGRRLAVGSVALSCADAGELVAQASVTYSIPPPERRVEWTA